MLKDLDQNATVRIPCPKCAEKIELTVAAIGYSPSIRCTKCGVLFKVDGRKVLEKVRQAAKQADLAKRRMG